MHELGLQIRAMSEEIPKSAADLGSAYYDILSSGVTDTAKAMEVLELSAKAASAGVTQTAVAAQAGVATMNAFGYEVSDMTHIFDVQFLAVKVGILRYEELAGVIGDIAPSAQMAGQSMESMFASIALLTTKGLDAASAATALARAYDGIAKPESIKAAAALGISFIEMTEESTKARDNFLAQKEALDGLTTSYEETQTRAKTLSDETASLSLQEAKNRIEIEKLKRETQRQDTEVTALARSYTELEGTIKSMNESMAKLSLEEAKNRLEISKIKREAEKEGRELTTSELESIALLESKNADLSLSYEELSVKQQEARLNGEDLKEQVDAETIAREEAIAKAYEPQLTKIAELEAANLILSDTMDGLSISQKENDIVASGLTDSLQAQKSMTEEASKAFDEQIAISGDFRPLVDIIQDINTKYGDLSDSAQADIISQMFPEVRARKAILGIMGSEQDLINMTAEMETGVGAMGDAYAIVSDTTAASNQLMQNSMDNLKIEMGEELMPVMQQFNEIMVTSIIPMIQNTFIPILQASLPVIQALAGAVGVLAGIFADYPELLWAIIGAIVAWKAITIAATVIQGLQTAATILSTAATWAFNTALLANPLVWIVILIVALIAALYLLWKHWDDVKVVLEQVWNAFKDFGNWVMSGLKAAFDYIVGAIQYVIDGLKWLWDKIIAVGEIFYSVWEMSFKIPLELIKAGIDVIVDVLQTLWDMIKKVGDFFNDTFGAIVDTIGSVGGFLGDVGGGIGSALGFAEGGVVTSPTLGLIGEAGAEAVIPLKNGAVPVDFGGSTGGGDTITINIQTGILPQQETPDSLANKVATALAQAKKRGATGQVTG
jgi:TP901 family phage tail tape measure protein